MKAAARGGAAALIAIGLVAIAAVLNVRGPRTDRTDEPDRGVPASSALLQPGAGLGSVEGTIGLLQGRLRSVPDDWRGFASLGLAYVAEARVTADPSWYPKAEDALRRSLRLNAEDNVDALLGLGTLALARHDFGTALRRGRAAEALNPYDADVYGVIGDALLELGRYRAAFDAFQTMVDTRPGLPAYARVSYARELTGDVPGAVRAMAEAFDAAGTRSDAAWAAYQLGELEFGRGQVRSAETWYRRGLELAPSFVPNLAGTAKVAWARGHLDAAVERYGDVVARYPSVEYVTALGDLYAVTGRTDLAEQQYAVVEATRELARASGVNVDLDVALFDADHGDPRAALAAAEAEWERRHSVHVADAYAWALHANGRDREAAEMMDRGLRLGTRNAGFLFHAGMIQHSLGRDDAARRLLQRALDLNPSFSILLARTAERTLAGLEAGG